MADNRHLWYLIMLMEVFVLFNLLNRQILKYPIITTLLLLALNIKLVSVPIASGWYLVYFLYFYMGYMFMHKGRKIKDKITLGSTAVVITLTLLYWLWLNPIITSWVTNEFVLRLFDIFMAVLGTFTLYSLSVLVSKTSIPATRIYTMLKKNSFGIYLFHPAIIFLMLYLLKDFPINSYLYALSIFVVSLLGSIGLTLLVRQCRGKILIGE